MDFEGNIIPFFIPFCKRSLQNLIQGLLLIKRVLVSHPQILYIVIKFPFAKDHNLTQSFFFKNVIIILSFFIQKMIIHSKKVIILFQKR
jgi:hypothetical protein